MRKRYPIYKDSGIEWLGEIPEHWQLMRAKYLMSNPVIRSNGSSLPFIALEDIESCTGDTIPSFVWEEKTIEDAEIFMPGDVLFTKLRPYLRKYILADRKGCCQTELLVLHLTSDSYLPKYLYYAVQTEYFVSLADSTSYGVKMPRTSWEKINQHCLQVPTTDEQRKIVDYLDKEASKINILMSKKENQIDLLKEKRAAVITRAVTKGLDPNVPMKDSGIEWLGEIPEHWNMKRLKYVASINAHSLSEDTDPNFIMQYVDIGNVDSVGNIDKGEELRFSGAPSRARRTVTQGDTILSTVRTYLKAIAFVNAQIDNLVVSTGFAVIHANNDLVPKYLFYVLRSEMFVDAVVANSEGVGYPAITPSKLVCLPTWAPDTSEQQQIIEFIDSKIQETDKLISQIQSSIDKLKEYRTTLISATVTGKIDVRGE